MQRWVSYACIAPGDQNPISTIDGLFEGPTLTSFNLFGLPMLTWTAAIVGGELSTSGNPIQGTVDTLAGTISLDMGSLFSSWNGDIHSQAPRSATGALTPVVNGTFDPLTGAFDIAWSSFQIGGSTQGFTNYWHLTGTAVAAIPDPESYALMLSGLALIAAAARKARSQSPSAST